MKTYDDYQNRLPEHPEPKGLAAHVEESAAAAPRTAKPAPAYTADIDETHGGGALGWAVFAAVAVAICVGAIYFLSHHGYSAGVDSANRVASAMPAANTATPANVITVYTIEEDVESVPVATAQRPAASAAASTASATAATTDDAVYLFPLDGSDIAENADLNAVARKAAETGAYVSVVAYTDESGRAAYNQRLSEKRARKVGDYLVAHGVARDHITTKGMGPTHAYPTAAQDRRAEIHLN